MKVIADIGHNWHPDRGGKIVDAVRLTGVTDVALPLFKADKVYREEADVKRTRPYELSESGFLKLSQKADEFGLSVWATPYWPGAVEIAERAGVVGYRLADGDLRYDDLVFAIADTGKPVLVSVGLYGFPETDMPFDAIGRDKITVLHSTGQRPTPPDKAQLNKILRMAGYYWEHGIQKIGLDSYNSSELIDMAAMAYNLDVLVKKVDLGDGKGIEAAYSANPKTLERLVLAAAMIPGALHTNFELENLSDVDLLFRNDFLRDPDDFLVPCECHKK